MAEVVLVTGVRGVIDVELLVGVSEGDRPDLRVQRRPAGVAAVIVPERAPGNRIDRRVPRRIELAIRTDHGVAVVHLGGAVVAWPGRPDPVGLREADRRAVSRILEYAVAASGGRERNEQGQ